jgi:hypothetical protein
MYAREDICEICVLVYNARRTLIEILVHMHVCLSVCVYVYVSHSLHAAV